MQLRNNIYLLILCAIVILATSSLWMKVFYIIIMLLRGKFIAWESLKTHLNNGEGTIIFYRKGLIHKVLWTELIIKENDFSKIKHKCVFTIPPHKYSDFSYYKKQYPEMNTIYLGDTFQE